MSTGKITAAMQSFPTSNGLAPQQGPKALPVALNFTVNSRIEFDFVLAEESNTISFVQSVFVDNSDNPNPLTINVAQTGQRIVIPGYAQGFWPVIACEKPQFVVTTMPGVTAIGTLIFMNVPMPLTQWGPVSTTANLVVSGSFTNYSNTATGASVQIIAANAARTGLIIENLSSNANSIFVNFGAAATDNSGAPDSIEIMPGGYIGLSLGNVSVQSVNILGTNGQKFIVKEM
jgi:hypothetical protein